MLSPSLFFPPLSPSLPNEVLDVLHQALPGESVVLTGPLPASALFHAALNHLRVAVLEEFPSEDHAEAIPAAVKPYVLLLTPDRQALYASMVKEPDAWLAKNSGLGETLQLLDMIDIKVCPTLAHFRYLLTTLQVPPDDAPSEVEYCALPRWPTMIIAYNPSIYFEANSEGTGISAYTSLIALLLDTCKYIGTQSKSRPALILYEEKLHPLSFPVIPPHLRPASPKKSTEGELSRRAPPKVMSLSDAVGRYIPISLVVSPLDIDTGYTILNEKAYNLSIVQSIESPLSVYLPLIKEPKEIAFWIVKKEDEDGFSAMDLQHHRFV